MNGASQAMWTLAGVVEAPVEQVLGVLFNVRPGRVDGDNGLVLSTEGPAEYGAIVLEGGPHRFTATAGQPAVTSVNVEVDREGRRLVVQGHFWYRGVYTLEPHERGSRILYRVYNVAPGVPQWLVRLWQFQFPRRMRNRFQRLLHAVGGRLACAAYPIGG